MGDGFIIPRGTLMMQMPRSLGASSGFLPLCGIIFLFYAVRMTQLAIAIIFTAIWVACNFYLWSLKQDQLILFMESLGMSAIAFPAIYWYVTRRSK